MATMSPSIFSFGRLAISISALVLSANALPQAMPLGRVQARQANQFNPDPASGLDDPTIQVADPSFATAIKEGYQGPMASYVDHALVGPVDLLRSGTVNYGVNPNFTMPLYYGKSANGTGYWWIVTDSSDEGSKPRHYPPYLHAYFQKEMLASLGSTSPPNSDLLPKEKLLMV